MTLCTEKEMNEYHFNDLSRNDPWRRVLKSTGFVFFYLFKNTSMIEKKEKVVL